MSARRTPSARALLLAGALGLAGLLPVAAAAEPTQGAEPAKSSEPPMSAKSANSAERAKAAIFPIELFDPAAVGGRKPRPDEVRKLGLVTGVLRDALTSQGGLEPVDLAPQSAEIAKQAPLFKCDGCAAPIAKTLGADLAVTGYVEKGSGQIFILNVSIADAATGKAVRGGQVVIRADTDDTWTHAMRSVVKNRLLAEPLPGKS